MPKANKDDKPKNGAEMNDAIDESMSAAFDAMDDDNLETDDESELEAEQQAEKGGGTGSETDEDSGDAGADEEESDEEEDSEQESDEEEDADEEEGDEEDLEEESEQEEALNQAPETWARDAAADWDKLTPRAKEEILRREDNMKQYYAQNNQRIQFAASMEKLAGPYMPAMHAAGITLVDNIANLLNTQYRIQNGTPADIAQIALEIVQQNGNDTETLRQLIGGGTQVQAGDGQGGQPGNIDIANHPLFKNLQEKLNRFEQAQVQQTNEQQQQQRQEVQLAVRSFRNELGDDGKPLRPYFDTVYSDMVADIPFIKRQHPGISYKDLLAKAYERAIWANPETRKALQTKSLGSQKRKVSSEAKKKVTAAKRKAKGNLKAGLKPSSSGGDSKGSIDDTMNATMNKIQNRG